MRLFDLIKRKLFRQPPLLVDCVRDKEWYERKYGKEVNEYMKWKEDYEDVGSPGEFGILLKNSSFKDLSLNSKPSEWKLHSGDVIKWVEEVIKFVIQIIDNEYRRSGNLLESLEIILQTLEGIKGNLIEYEKSKELREKLERERYSNVIYTDFHELNKYIGVIKDERKKLDKESELYKKIGTIVFNSLWIIHISHMILFNRTFKDYNN